MAAELLSEAAEAAAGLSRLEQGGDPFAGLLFFCSGDSPLSLGFGSQYRVWEVGGIGSQNPGKLIQAWPLQELASVHF